MPLLLTCARFPVEFACNVLTSGSLSSVQTTLDIQGLAADVQIEHADSLQLFANFFQPDIFRNPIVTARGEVRTAAEHWVQKLLNGDSAQAPNPVQWTAAAQGRARDMKSRVDLYNAASAQINQRVIEALTRATGEDLRGQSQGLAIVVETIPL